MLLRIVPAYFKRCLKATFRGFRQCYLPVFALVSRRWPVVFMEDVELSVAMPR